MPRFLRDRECTGVPQMTEMYAHVSVRILEKEYQVSCPANERTALLDSAEMLNVKMREIRDSGKVVGLDRIAVMAALNMANELLKTKAKDEAIESSLGPRLKVLNERVESILGNQQLEL
jgi:cell division protein ZapA